MAQISTNAELRAAGYIGFRPEALRTAAEHRKPGYLEHCEQIKRDPGDGLWYFTHEQLGQIRVLFSLAEVTAREIKQNTDTRQWTTQQVIRALEANLFNAEEPCKFKHCERLREAYLKEVKAQGAACPTCQLNRIRAKYKTFLTRIVEVNEGKNLIESDN